MTSVKITHGAVEKTISFSQGSAKTYKVASRWGESDSAFIARAKEEAAAWAVDNLGAAEEVSYLVEGEANTVSVFFNASNAVTLSGIIIENIGGASDEFVAQWDDRYYTPDASQTPPKRKTYMDGPGEYPACVCISQQRLIWASTANDPARVLMSAIGNFNVYAPHDVLVDDDAIDFQVSATSFPKVNHLVELRKLILFNGASEWIVDSASSSSGITYATIQARQHSAIGADAKLKPIVCNNVLLFAERTGQAVRRYGYQLEDDGFGGDDISIFSSSIFRGRKIVAWAYQQHPHSTCWCVLDDGKLCSLTFMPEQQTVAWAEHELGGGCLARDIVATGALIGNGQNRADTSEVFLLVERVEDGRSVWTIERFRCDARHGEDSCPNALHLDSMRTLAAGHTLRPDAVAIDPATGEERSEAVAGLIEGFPFTARFTSVYPVVAEEVGLAQMDVKCVQAVHLRLADSVGGTVRAHSVPAAEASRLAATPLRVENGILHFEDVDENVPLVTDNSRDGRVTVEQSEPWPFTLLMIESDLECELSQGGQ